MEIRAVELVLRKLIEAMERRCAGFPIRYELELLTIETAKEQLDKIQAELEAPANMQTHLSLSLENEMTKVNCDSCTGLACGDECDGKSHATLKPAKVSEDVEVAVGSKWNYDRSLDHATWKPPLVVKAITDGPTEKCITFDQSMPYASYGISYFGKGFGFPFTPYDDRLVSRLREDEK